MRFSALLLLALAGCSNLLGIDHFTTADASENPDTAEADASTVDSAMIDAPMIDAPIIDAAVIDAHVDASVDAMVDAKPPDAMVDAKIAICGDGVVDPGEGCDDHNNVNGDGCSATCGIESGYACSGSPSVCTTVCGDGIVAGGEVCDDGNNKPCGTCNATCTAAIVASPATGMFTWNGGPAPPALDSATITLNDGVNPPVTFEWDDNGFVMPGNVPIAFADNQNGQQTANGLAATVNGQGSSLLITATSNPPNVNFTNDRASVLGNQPIQFMSFGFFNANGMNGGAAGDCPVGTGCTAGVVCATANCNAATKTCQ